MATTTTNKSAAPSTPHGARREDAMSSTPENRSIQDHLEHLDALESESMHIFREVAGSFERPAFLFSGGKDSIVMLRLAEKAFRPGRFPFPLVHVDTGHNFPEVISFRDKRAAQLGETLIVRSVEDSLRTGRIVEKAGQDNSRNRMQITTLLDAIAEFKFDALFGGARRDEEKARAKERIFSFRDSHGQWDPKNQRPELWNLYNARIHPGEHIRVFPISNWTELDIWMYIAKEKLEIPSIYYAHEREVVWRDQWIPISHLLHARPAETVERRVVRFRTVGDMTCTGCVESPCANAWDIIEETAASRVTERGSRVDDKASEAAMEDRKKEGYF
jgi:sulfate adenylyltransferase subunit 2